MKGSKAKSIGDGFKLFYHDMDGRRNEVGIILKENLTKSVLEVKRVSDRMMSMKLVIEGIMIIIISAYAPQIGYAIKEKERFLE